VTAAAGPDQAGQPVTLASLAWEWGDAYDLGYQGDQWSAARRDGRGVLAADTLAELEAAIEDDYRNRPVPRAFDPPTPAGHDSDPDEGRAGDESFLLAAMRYAFPAWTLDYSTELRLWTAHDGTGTLCVDSAVLLCAALVLIEGQRHRTAR
jgi:hypothetical protein